VPLDPLNAERVLDNGMQRAEFNHYFGMPAYQPSVWLRANATDLAGRLQTEQLQGDMLVSGGTREVRFYHPPSAAPCPLLVVYDGPDYHERAALVQVVDNLITAGRIQPIALALLQNGGPARLLEYGCNDVTIGFLQEVVLPFAQQQGNLLDWRKQPGCYGVLGASMGGVMALYTGLRAPHIFGNVFAQAGAYSLPSYYASDFDLVVYPLVENLTPPALHIWQDCGRFDFLLPTNRRMADLLRLRGYRHTYHEYSAGHNYTAWRDQLAAGLQLLFPSL
jgi:enterochelin esterase-like enzyme